MNYHLHLPPSSIPEHVIVTGDPYRAKSIATALLSNTQQLSQNRGLWSFSGLYKQQPILIQTTGIGTPSAALVLHELLYTRNVVSIARIGTCCAVSRFQLNDTIVCRKVLAEDGTTLRLRPSSSPCWLEAEASIRFSGSDQHIPAGQFVTTDTFYLPHPQASLRSWEKQKIDAIDMETSILYHFGLCRHLPVTSVCVVSDSLKIDRDQVIHETGDAIPANRFSELAATILSHSMF